MITEKKKILLFQIVTFITMIVFIIIPIVVLTYIRKLSFKTMREH